MAKNRREDILQAAAVLFFQNGYEATSVRMIMDAVGGEIGMFYHHFKSKDALFDAVAERFFLASKERFEGIMQTCRNPGEFVDSFLPAYLDSMKQFEALKGNMHWSIQYAMHARTIDSMIPTVAALLERWEVKTDSMEMLSAQLIHGVSATIHSKHFESLDDAEKKQCLLSYIHAMLPGLK